MGTEYFLLVGRDSDEVDSWNQGALKSFVALGGLLLAVALQQRLLPVPATAVDFCYAAIFVAGLLLAWRFHSTRILFALATLVLAGRALAFFSAGKPWPNAPSHSAFNVIAVFLPLNFIVLSCLRERGFTAPATGLRLLLLFVQSVVVAVAGRPDIGSGSGLLDATVVSRGWFSWMRVSQFELLAFAAAFVVVATRFALYRKPVEGGFFWSLLAVLLALQYGGVGPAATAYLGAAGLVLVVSVVETSYLMAYHDELTGLPGRRAFTEKALGLESRYAIAIVDVDHFKQFNDTYGHETGDQVLRMVASRLAHVTGGGQAFRCGGEEFSVVFPGKSVKDALDHLELLRKEIEQSSFRVRDQPARRSTPRGPDRRRTGGKKAEKRKSVPVEAGREEVSVTVSIGVAEASTRNRDIEQVIRAADRALYRAKEGGRNRVEIDHPYRSRGRFATKEGVA